MTEIAARRLHTQRLAGPPCSSPREVVGWLTAVQSQDYGGAKWALAQRAAGTTQAEIDRLFDDGAILRTHVLRPTWHFVLPDDIGWLLALTGPKVRAGLASRHRQLEIDGELVARVNQAFTAALWGGRSLTRPEMGEVLEVVGIVTVGQRLPHFLMAAELEGLITSGPRRGKQHTYALLDERAPSARTLDREEALAELTRRYFRSHGPAQVQDFVWWSGLSATEARAGIALAGAALVREDVDGVDFWSGPEAVSVSDVMSIAHLLPNFDEYTVAYRDRTAALDPELPFDPTLFSFGSILSNVVTIGGKVRGTWRRTVTGAAVCIEVGLLAPLASAEVDAVQANADRMGYYIGRTVELRGL